MLFAPRHAPKQRSPYTPLWAVPVTLGVIALGYYCVIRPTIEIYRIEKYLSEYERKHETQSSSSRTNAPSLSEINSTNAALEQRIE